MSTRILIMFAATLLIAAHDPKIDPTKREFKRLQGTWVVDSLEQEGRPVSAAKLEKARGTWVINDDEITINSEPNAGKWSFTIDPEKAPKEIVLTALDGPRTGKAMHAVYSIVAETLTICLNSNTAKGPPAAFDTRSGDGRRCYGLRRDTPEEHDGVLFLFDHPDAAQEWHVVNEKESDGRFRLTDRKTLEFYGTRSPTKVPGWASLRSEPRRLGLEKGDAMIARVRGDGGDYTLNLYPAGASYFARRYQASFSTKKDEWIEVRVPLEKLTMQKLGGFLQPEQVSPNGRHSLGFMAGDKNNGPFKLEVEWIKVEQAKPQND